MQLTIKKLLGLTLLAALLVNGLINHFAARSLQQELDRDPLVVVPGKQARFQGTGPKLEQRVLLLERAIEANERRRTQLEKLGIIDPQNASDSQSQPTPTENQK